MKPRTMLKVVRMSLSKHSNGILTGIAIAGTIGATIFALRDGPKCKKVLEELNEKGASNVEKAKEVTKILAPTIVCVAVSAGANIANCKRTSETIKNLMDAYSTVSVINDLREEKTRKIVGDKKADEINRAVARPTTTSVDSYVVQTGHGNDLFYDSWSGRWFTSDINHIKKVTNDLNYQLLNDLFIGLNEYYVEVGLPEIDCGKELGWNVDYGTIDLEFSAEMDDCDKPYTLVQFKNLPELKYVGSRGRW